MRVYYSKLNLLKSFLIYNQTQLTPLANAQMASLENQFMKFYSFKMFWKIFMKY